LNEGSVGCRVTGVGDGRGKPSGSGCRNEVVEPDAEPDAGDKGVVGDVALLGVSCESADGWNRLEMPATIMPGCRPRNGESMEMVPMIRCLKGC
jgi:hypothetical protein